MARKAHKIAAGYDEAADAHVIDEAETERLRREEREARKQRAVPVADWLRKERARVVGKNFVPLVQQMYAGSFAMSARWRQEYIDFWNLDPDFDW